MRVVYYGRELYHAATGQERQNHKYIARVREGDKYRYFYNQFELAAYKAGKGISNTAGKAVTDAGYFFKNPKKYFEGKAAIKSNKALKNKNDRNTELARQGKSNNPLGRGIAIVRRTVNNNIVQPVAKGAKSVSDGFNKTISDAQKAYKDYNAKMKYKKDTRMHDFLRNPSEKNIETSRAGQTTNTKNYLKAVRKREGRNSLVESIAKNAAPKKKEESSSIVIKDPPKSTSNNSTPRSNSSSIKPVLVEPGTANNKRSTQDNNSIKIFENPKNKTQSSNSKHKTNGSTPKPVLVEEGKATNKKSVQDSNSITIFDNPRSSSNNSKPTNSSSSKPTLSDSTTKPKNRSEALKAYTDYYIKQYIKEGADLSDAKRWANAAAQKRLKEDFKQ